MLYSTSVFSNTSFIMAVKSHGVTKTTSMLSLIWPPPSVENITGFKQLISSFFDERGCSPNSAVVRYGIFEKVMIL